MVNGHIGHWHGTKNQTQHNKTKLYDNNIIHKLEANRENT